MAEDKPLSVEEVLASEYHALRPGSGFDAQPVPGLPELFRRVHSDPQPLSALCISGGGIRSATFALGAVQGLAEQGLLERFDYLSTVSGGGYLGSWLTSWAHRIGGIDRVAQKLRRDASAPAPDEPDPIRHLREYNSYLSPRRGGLSADVWTLVATVLRNILLNWLVLIPVLLLALLPPRAFLTLLCFPEILFGREMFHFAAHDYSVPALDAISGSPWVAFGLPALSALLFGTAWFNILRCLPGVGNRNHSRADYARWVLGPLVGAVFTFLMFDSLYFLGSRFANSSNLRPVVAWAIVPACGAWLLYLGISGGSARRRLGLLFSPLSLAIAFMAAGIGAAAWATTNFLLWSPNPDAQISWAQYVTFGPSLVLLGFYLGTALFLGLASSALTDEDREWMSRAMAGVLIFCFGWTLLCTLVLILPRLAFTWGRWENGVLAVLGSAGAWLASRGLRDDGRPSLGDKILALLPGLVTKVAPIVFLCVLSIALSAATDALLFGLHGSLGGITGLPLAGPQGEPVAWNDHDAMLSRSQPLFLLLLALLLVVFAWLMARAININIFSLHGMYRERLIRAYLGASNPLRQANLFTGFAPDDNLAMAELDPRRKPLHVLNLTLNLVATNRLDWQQRKAQPFTVSPLACGNADLGYRPSAAYGGEGGISLGTAVAISGAAASPSMGSFSSPITGFIMTLFNARLGAWLGNPGEAGTKTWQHAGPKAAIGSLAREALGLTGNEAEYVYLSDGGHFENFGLYEMVRRRCRTIVVLDGGADPLFSFDDLGNALRKIRIDLRVPIDFHLVPGGGLRDRKRRCASATIRYSAVDGPGTDGKLLYIKPLFLGDEPPDVVSYARGNPTFPHQSTADQWFNESQTESYRQLGLFTLDELASRFQGGSLEDFVRHVEAGYLSHSAEMSGEPKPRLTPA